MDEGDFLSLVLARRPELSDLLLRPLPAHYKEVDQASAAFRPCDAPSSIYNRIRPAPPSAPRNLTIKGRIEGALVTRRDSCALPAKPPANPGSPLQPSKPTSALATSRRSSDIEELAGAASYEPATADEGYEFSSEEDLAAVGDYAIEAQLLSLPADNDYAATLSVLNVDVHAQHAILTSRRGTYDGVLPTAVLEPAGPQPASASPRRVRSTSSPCGIDLTGGHHVDGDDEDDDDWDDGDGSGGGCGDEFGGYGEPCAGQNRHPSRHLAASLSFRDMAGSRGWRPAREGRSWLRLGGIPVRAASSTSSSYLLPPPDTGFGPQTAAGGSGREQRPLSPEGSATEPQRGRAGSQSDALEPPPVLLLPICPPARLSRTPDPGLRRGTDNGGAAADGGAAGPEAGAGTALPRVGVQLLDPQLINERHLRSCRSSGAHCFLPSRRAKHSSARLRRLRSRLSTEPEPEPGGDDAAEAGTEAEVDVAGGGPDDQAGDGPPCEDCSSPLMRIASSPARMMLARSSPLPLLCTGRSVGVEVEAAYDEAEDEDEGGSGWAADVSRSLPEAEAPKAASRPAPPRRGATVLDLQLQLDVQPHGAGALTPPGGRSGRGGGGGGGDGASPSSRGVSSTAPGGAGGSGGGGSGGGDVSALSVRSLAAAGSRVEGSGCPASQPSSPAHWSSPKSSGGVVVVDVDAAAAAAAAATAGGGGSANCSGGGGAAAAAPRQTMQLPVRQPQPPLLPYGGILRLAVSHGGVVPFGAAHQRGNTGVGRLAPQPQSRSCNVPLQRNAGGGGGSGSGGHGAATSQPGSSRGVLVLRSMAACEQKAMSSHGGGSPAAGPPASPALSGGGGGGGSGGERSAARVGGSSGGGAALLQSPCRPRCSDSGTAPLLDAAGGDGGTAPGGVDGGGGGDCASGGGGGAPHNPVLLADFLAAAAAADGGGVRLGVLGNCRPDASAAAPLLLPFLRTSKGPKGINAHGSPSRQRHVMPPPPSGPVANHCRSSMGGPVSDAGGGGGRLSGTAETGMGIGGATAVAVVLAVADGSGTSLEARQHRAYKLGFTTNFAAPTVAAAVRHSSETHPAPAPNPASNSTSNPSSTSGRSSSLLPVISPQSPMRPASKPGPGAFVVVPFPTVSQPRASE